MKRRSFLAGLLGLAAVPQVVKAGLAEKPVRRQLEFPIMVGQKFYCRELKDTFIVRDCACKEHTNNPNTMCRGWWAQSHQPDVILARTLREETSFLQTGDVLWQEHMFSGLYPKPTLPK